MNLLHILQHPLAIFFAATNVFSFTAGSTRQGSPWRYVSLAFLAMCALRFSWSIQHFTGLTGWAGRILGGSMFWNIVSCFDRLILRGWDYEHYGPNNLERSSEASKVSEKGETLASTRYPGRRSEFATEVTGRARGVNLFWEVKNVPPFSEKNPDLVPTRAAFVLVQAFTIVCCYYLHNIAVEATFSLNPDYLSAGCVPLLTRMHDVSWGEWKARTIASVGYWIEQYAMMQFFFSVTGALTALAKVEAIKDFRPLFGSPKHSYTLRKFWGRSWHQTLRSGLGGASAFLTHEVLSLPTEGTLQRYTNIFISFAISGIMHIFADMGGGLSARQSGALRFFCMQALGIMIEDGVQAIYSRHFRSGLRSWSIAVERTIGYVWVLLFLIWSTPIWVFPATLQMRREHALLHFSAAKPLFGIVP